MTLYRNLDRGDVLPASWTDAIQEQIGTLVEGLRFTIPSGSTNTLRVVGSTGSGQVCIGIDGLVRYRTTNHDVVPTGTAGVKDVYVIASANSFATSPQPDTDLTDYNWYLTTVAGGAAAPTGNTPAGNPIVASRKVAEVDWDGAKITGVRQLVGAGDVTNPIQPTAPNPDVAPIRGKGVTGQAAPLLTLGLNATADDRLSLSAAGTLSLPAGGLTAGTNVLAAGYLHGRSGGGAGEGLRIGNDGSLHDVDTADTINLRGLQTAAQGFLSFGSGGDVKIGRGATATQLDVTGNLSISGQYRIGGTQISAANLSNGTTGTGNVVLATNPTLTGTSNALVLNPTAAGGNWITLQNNGTTNWQMYAPSGGTTFALFGNGADRLTLSNTGTLTVATVNAGTGIQVGGTALAASHLSDGANLAHINATETITGAWTLTGGGKNAVAVYVGDQGSVAAYTASDLTGVIRMGGSTVAWGDLGYFPNGGTVGHFRFNLAGSGPNSTASGRIAAGYFNAVTGFEVNGTALAASHLSNGITGTGAVVLAASPTLSGTPLAPTPAQASNDTTIATTAYVTSKVAAATPTGVGYLANSQTWTGTNTFSHATTPIVIDSGTGTNDATLTLTGRSTGTAVTSTIRQFGATGGLAITASGTNSITLGGTNSYAGFTNTVAVIYKALTVDQQRPLETATGAARLSLTGRNAGTAATGYLEASSAGVMTLNAPSGSTIQLAIAGTTVLTAAAAGVVTLSASPAQASNDNTVATTSYVTSKVAASTPTGVAYLANSQTFTGSNSFNPSGSVVGAVIVQTSNFTPDGSGTDATLLRLRGGNNGSVFDNSQVAFSYATSDNYSHRLVTRHNSSAQAGNSIDFYTWKQGTDLAGAMGTQHVLTLDGNGRVGINGKTSPAATLDVGGDALFGGDVVVRAAGATARVALVPGNSTSSGVVEWYRPDGARLGSMGRSETDVELALDSTASFYVRSVPSGSATAELPTLKTESREVYFATVPATQRYTVFGAPVAPAAAVAGTITNAATVAIAGAPATGGANVTITNAYALWIQGGRFRTEGDIYAQQAVRSVARFVVTDGATNLWNIDNSAGTMRFFREDYNANGAGGNGSVKLTINNTGDATFSNAVLALNVTGSRGDVSVSSHVGNIYARDTRSFASGVGGLIMFQGSYTGTSPTEFGAIGGLKETGGDQDYNGELRFWARSHGTAFAHGEYSMKLSPKSARSAAGASINGVTGNSTEIYSQHGQSAITSGFVGGAGGFLQIQAGNGGASIGAVGGTGGNLILISGNGGSGSTVGNSGFVELYAGTIASANTLLRGYRANTGVTRLGFYDTFPVARNTTNFTNTAGVNTGTYTLPAAYTMGDIAAVLMTLIKQLGSNTGMGLVGSAF